MPSPSRRPAAQRLLAGATCLTLLAAASAAAAGGSPTPDAGAPARTVPFALVQDRPVDDRLPQPEDRYAPAGGCYTIEVPGRGFLTRRGGALGLDRDAAQALPLHWQATRLGEYLLATDEGRDPRYPGAWWDARNYLAAPALSVTGGDAVTVATAPSPDAEWRLAAAGDDPERRAPSARSQEYVLTNRARQAVLTADDTGVRAVTGAGARPTPVRLHLVDSTSPLRDRCAVWPEVQTGASGRPKPAAAGTADVARGFFESHVHGMAFEFLGGKLRCGRPWDPYGVEYALPDCSKTGNPFNAVLEVGVAGKSPTDPVQAYDPVGWPTFGYWPQNDTLTHEQFYWKWLERAYAGGLRLMTNLLVDNTALCQAYPVKKNSCNEMDGVRLQAQRLFELQDYIDAQSGGPGEGWFRIVTTPAQARQVINAGRLAVVLGIEVSVLFDCNETLDRPECTAQQIDDRLQEVFDMGVRQMELVNKFDNALSGVTGDSGLTGPIVNAGQKRVTGHFWDMRGCPATTDAHGPPGEPLGPQERDRTQPGVADATPAGAEGVDALAGRILQEFGGVTSVLAPVYGPGPHCNTRGLTDLGAYLVRAMVAKGMIFDPDHMSALAEHEALDLLAGDTSTRQPARQQGGQQQGGQEERQTRPAVLSSHSWANPEVYRRIYRLDGMVAPRTSDAASFVDTWRTLRGYAAANAPAGYDFAMGYGADTNGLGGQPGPRSKPARPLDYRNGFDAPIGGVHLTQQQSGLKTYDINRDGVAQYGLFADWYRELVLAADEKAADLGGGKALLADLLNGPEVFLRMWERGVYGGGQCVRDGSTLQPEDLHALLGANLDGFLRAAGQPASREGSAYRYCTTGPGGALRLTDVTFDASGTVRSVTDAGPAPG